MPRAELVCLVCGKVPVTLDTQVEVNEVGRVVRRRLVECRKCGTVRIYRISTTVEDKGDHAKRYLRDAARDRLR